MEFHKLFITTRINALACRPSPASIISHRCMSTDCMLARSTVRTGVGCAGWSIGPAPWPWPAFIRGPCFFWFDYPMTVWAGTLTMFSFLWLCRTTSVCAPNFGFHLDTATRCLMLQPLSLTAPPVSASLLFKDRIPVESARAAAPSATRPPSIALSTWPYAIRYETAPFHRYLTSLGSRSWQLSTWSIHTSGWRKVYPWEADKWADSG